MTFQWPRKKRNKYGNVPCYALGIKFRSKRERDYAIYLESEKTAGRIMEWVYEQKFELWAGNPEAGLSVVGFHKPDFYVFFLDKKGNQFSEVHEIKQPFTKTSTWALKKKLFEANYPGIKYKVIEK